MNYWAKLGLGVLAFGAVVGVWYGDEYYTKKEEAQKTVDSKALNFEAKDVVGITLTNTTNTFSFERPTEKDKWSMSQPQKVAADQEAINEFLNAFAFMNVSSRLSDYVEADASKYGLDKPVVTLVLTLKDAKTRTLTIGNDLKIGVTKDSSTGVNVYAKSSDHKQLLVLGRGSIDAAKKTVSDFRNKVLGAFTLEEIKSFTLSQNDGTKLKLVKSEKDWKITEPKEMVADNNNVGLFVDKISKLKLTGIQEAETLDSAKLSGFGLAIPSAVFEVFGEGDKLLQRIEYGLDAKNVYLKMADGAVGHVDLGQFADLAPTLKYFRDKRVTKDVSIDKLSKLTTKSGKSFVREETNWYPAVSNVPEKDPKDDKTAKDKPPVRTADSNVGQFISEFEFLTGEDVIDAADVKSLETFGLDKPITTFQLESNTKDIPVLTVLIGNRVPKNESSVYIKHSGSENVYVVKSSWVDQLNKLDGIGTDVSAKK